MTQNNAQKATYIEALQWYLDHGVDEVLVNTPIDRTLPPEMPKLEDLPEPVTKRVDATASLTAKQNPTANVLGFQENLKQEAPSADMMGAAQAIIEAQKLAASVNTLDELQAAIRDFDGLSVKQTASNLVFADGNSQADVMLIGEAPGADEDIEGKPFVGSSGQLLDKILACIGLDRQSETPKKGVYISNVMNWRPPGNRTPTDSEIEISLAFIERHIALVKPKVLILCGGVAAKALLRNDKTISKLRTLFHDYKTPDVLNGGQEFAAIPAIVTYHPAYLLNTPAQKKAVWADMLMLQDKLATL